MSSAFGIAIGKRPPLELLGTTAELSTGAS